MGQHAAQEQQLLICCLWGRCHLCFAAKNWWFFDHLTHMSVAKNRGAASPPVAANLTTIPSVCVCFAAAAHLHLCLQFFYGCSLLFSSILEE